MQSALLPARACHPARVRPRSSSSSTAVAPRPLRRPRPTAAAAAAKSSASASASSPAVFYECSKCSARPAQPMGRCPVCREWGTVERRVAAPPVFLGLGGGGGGGGEGLSAARRAVAAAAVVAPVGTPAPFAAPPSRAASDPDALANATFLEFDDQGEPVMSAPSVAPPRSYASPAQRGWLVRDEREGPFYGGGGGGAGGGSHDDAAPERLADITLRRRREARAAAARDAAAMAGRSGPVDGTNNGASSSSHASFSSSSSTRLPMPTPTGAEVARVLGGGLVPGSVVLVGGDPGVGKSTLLLQVASLVARACAGEKAGEEGEDESARGGTRRRRGSAALSSSSPSSSRPLPPTRAPRDQIGRPVLYVSAEESKEQLWMRAVRLGLVTGDDDDDDDDHDHEHEHDGGTSGQAGSGSGSSPNAPSRPPPPPPCDLRLLSENRLEAVLAAVAELRPSLVIVDSVQTVLLEGLDHRPGSVSQVRECATALLHAAKRLRACVLLVGHVTKGGELAGPKALEHLVDAVVYLEGGAGGSSGGGISGGGGSGGGGGQYRVLRAQKNRFGSVGEVAILRHGRRGLEAVEDYRSMFVSDAAFDGGPEDEDGDDQQGGGAASSSSSAVGAGSALTIVQEGRRALVLEVQALVAERGGGFARAGGDEDDDDEDDDDTDNGNGNGDDGRRPWRPPRYGGGGGGGGFSPAPYRAAVGFASRERLPLLLEVLAKHGACAPARAARRASSVYASVAGGYRIRAGETATDLALCAAVVSSALGARLPRRTAVVGEVGLAGELRAVPDLESRLREAAAMGFERVVVPSANDARTAAAAAAAGGSGGGGGGNGGGGRRRGGGGGGKAKQGGPRALDGLRDELGPGMEVVSVPTLRAALRCLFGDKLRRAGGAAGGKQQQQQRRRRVAAAGGRRRAAAALAGDDEEEAEAAAALAPSSSSSSRAAAIVAGGPY